MPSRRFALVLPLLLLSAAPVRAQTSTEERLREVLRQTTVQLRALQDQQASLAAQLEQLKQERDSLAQQLEAAKTAPPPPDPALATLREAFAALQQQNAALQAGLQKWQAGYQQAAELARAKDADGRRLGQELQQATAKLKVCTGANGKLIAVAYEILHLYRTQGFRSLLVGSYEPLLGFKKVELENLVQDYEDRIEDQRLPPAAPEPVPTPAHRGAR